MDKILFVATCIICLSGMFVLPIVYAVLSKKHQTENLKEQNKKLRLKNLSLYAENQQLKDKIYLNNDYDL